MDQVLELSFVPRTAYPLDWFSTFQSSFLFFGIVRVVDLGLNMSSIQSFKEDIERGKEVLSRYTEDDGIFGFGNQEFDLEEFAYMVLEAEGRSDSHENVYHLCEYIRKYCQMQGIPFQRRDVYTPASNGTPVTAITIRGRRINLAALEAAEKSMVTLKVGS
jgi:hypothetical protein